MKNKLIIFFLLFGICSVASGCTSSVAGNNNSSNTALDISSQTEITESNVSNTNGLDEMIVKESEDSYSEGSNVELPESSSESSIESNISTESDLAVEDFQKDSSNSSKNEGSLTADQSGNEISEAFFENNISQSDTEDVAQTTSSKEIDSNDIGVGIALPDDEW